MSRASRTIALIAVVALAGLLGACGGTTGLFSASFNNFISGGVFPVTPGPGADFVMVRAVNQTDFVARFIVTIERRRIVRDDQGLPQFDENGQVVTEDVLETVELTTIPGGLSSDMGVLFPCSETPVIRVGLGETLLPGEPAVFLIEADAFDPANFFGVQPGFGVPASGINPLDLFQGNFNCGDTVIFRAIENNAVAGGVKLESFLLPGSEQPSIFGGPDTFVNYQRFLESQVSEEDAP